MGLQGHKKLIIPERVSRPNGCGCRRCSETYGDLRQRSGTSKFIHHFYHFARFFRGRCYRKWRVSKGKSGFANYQKQFEPIADFSRCARRCSLAKRILIVKTSFGTSGLNIFFSCCFPDMGRCAKESSEILALWCLLSMQIRKQ